VAAFELDHGNVQTFPWYMLGAATQAFGPSLMFVRVYGAFVALTPAIIPNNDFVDKFGSATVLPFLKDDFSMYVGDDQALQDKIRAHAITDSSYFQVMRIDPWSQTCEHSPKCYFENIQHDISKSLRLADVMIGDDVLLSRTILAILSKTFESAKTVDEAAASLRGHFMYRKDAKIRRIEVSNSDAKTGGAVILEHVSILEVETSKIYPIKGY